MYLGTEMTLFIGRRIDHGLNIPIGVNVNDSV